MSKFKGTNKEVFSLDFGGTAYFLDGNFYEANNIFDRDDLSNEEVENNTQLVLDAFNVRQEIDFDLPELKMRYDVMLEKLSECSVHFL